MNNNQTVDNDAMKTKIYYALSFAAVLIIAILFTFPLYWTITGAFKTGKEINASVPVWVARISKRRAIGKELADNERVLINGKIAKPSSEVKENDILTIYFGQKELTIKVLMLAKQVSKQQASLMFEVISEKKREIEAE